ncbi:MAG: hypothetical protein AAGA54_12850 [Myxococcota bacterium]
MREHVAALKHDLAKYVAWRSANYDDDAWEAPLQHDFVASLRDDVLRTKGELAAWQVWDAAAEAFGHPLPYPQLQAVAEAVQTLRSSEAALRDGGDALAEACPRIRAAQGEIRAQLRDLHRTLARG